MILRIQRNRSPFLWGCLAVAAFLCVAQILANTMLLLACMACFLLLSAWAAVKGFATPVILFFLPWSPLLKLAPDSMTFFTFMLIGVCLVSFLRRKFAINAYCVLCALPLVAVTLISKLMDGSGLTTSYILFVFFLFLFPTMMNELKTSVDFRTLTIYFSLGIITSALSAQQLVGFSAIARYIDVYTWNVVTRLSGYYGDANFYSAHISAALAGVMLLYLEEKKGRQRNLMMVLAVILMYCGFLSASKSFFVVIACVILLWIIRFISMRGRVMRKIGIMAAVIAVVAAVIASGIFKEQWEVIVFRFGQASDISSLTTGRSEIWFSYLRTLTSDMKLLLFGKGYINILVNGAASHNTIIQLLYQFGVIGCVFLAVWAYFFVRGTLQLRSGKARLLDTAILITGAFLPWMALDLAFFDEFFLMPLYVAAGLVYMGNLRETKALKD